MRFTINTTLSVSSEKAWSIFAHEFDDAHKWMASVPHSYAKPNGEQFDGAQSCGRVCELDQGGIKASEKFLDYNEEAKTCTVRIDFLGTPAFFPVDHNTLSFAVTDTNTDEGQSEMVWHFESTLKPWGFLMWPLLRLGFGIFVGQIVDELKYYLENDAPHPRKQKAIDKASASLNS